MTVAGALPLTPLTSPATRSPAPPLPPAQVVGQPSFGAAMLGTFFCAAHIMFALRDWEAEKMRAQGCGPVRLTDGSGPGSCSHLMAKSS